MAELFYTPPTEAEWVHLIEPKPQYDESKPPAWTCNLLFDQNHAIFQELKHKIKELHGNKKTTLKLPWKPHKTREGIYALKFKAVQLTRRDGTLQHGPRIVDAKKAPWEGGNIGNGSIIRICYFIHPFDRPDGHGVILVPKSVQVLKFVPISDGSEGFEEDENGYVQSSSNSEEGW